MPEAPTPANVRTFVRPTWKHVSHRYTSMYTYVYRYTHGVKQIKRSFTERPHLSASSELIIPTSAYQRLPSTFTITPISLCAIHVYAHFVHAHQRQENSNVAYSTYLKRRERERPQRETLCKSKREKDKYRNETDTRSADSNTLLLFLSRIRKLVGTVTSCERIFQYIPSSGVKVHRG